MSVVVISSQNLSRGVRGALTKWMLEIGPGTFVGSLPARIISELWISVDEWCEGEGVFLGAHATLVRTAKNEQGFVFSTSGEGRYLPVEHAGLWLVERSPRESAPGPQGHDNNADRSSEHEESEADTAVPW